MLDSRFNFIEKIHKEELSEIINSTNNKFDNLGKKLLDKYYQKYGEDHNKWPDHAKIILLKQSEFNKVFP